MKRVYEGDQGKLKKQTRIIYKVGWEENKNNNNNKKERIIFDDKHFELIPLARSPRNLVKKNEDEDKEEELLIYGII